MPRYKTYNPPGSWQETDKVKRFNLEVIWDDTDGSLIRCNIPEEVMYWDWVEGADLFSDLGGWAKTQVDLIYKNLDAPHGKKVFKKLSKKNLMPHLKDLKMKATG